MNADKSTFGDPGPRTAARREADAGGSPREAVPEPHCKTPEAVLAALGVDAADGLDDAAVRARRSTHGLNELDLRPPVGTLTVLIHQLASPIVALLGVAACLSGVLGDWTEAAAILVVLAINTAIGFATELKAERSMEALRAIGSHMQRVRRSGRTLLVPAEELVPGDILLLEAGDVATADARLTSAANLSVDESALTGESVPVDKSTAPVAPGTPIADRHSMLFKGTALTRGSAIGVVTATGMATELGKVAHAASRASPEPSPLMRNLARLTSQLIALTIAVAVAVAAAGVAHGHDPFQMIEAAIALAVAAIPEGLPIVATLVLARGMWRMAANGALIERLSAVETLGATTVIFTDKTGTLTENRMTVRRLDTPTCQLIVEPGRAIAPDSVTARLLEVAALCNDATLGSESHPATGDPLEIALLTASRSAHIDRNALLAAAPEVDRHPFDSATRIMATVHTAGADIRVAVKGAPEAVLSCAADIATATGAKALSAEEKALWLDRTDELARQGLRVLAFAERITSADETEPCRQLTFLGLAGLYDPPRQDVPDAIAACRQAGIRIVMLTGDHAITAASIAREVGLTSSPPCVIEGRALLKADGRSHPEIRSADVFARVDPSQKLDLVTVYQSAGDVVAMTGDGVNDAPALRKADIGVAMGQRGTEVARQAAAMILTDDSFTTIVKAIREGRIIFANIRRFVMYLLACNLAEVMVVGIAVAAGFPLPLHPLQILYLNIVTDVLPAFALALGEGDEGVLDRPPRPPAEPLVGRRQWIDITLFGAVMTGATLLAMDVATRWAPPHANLLPTTAFLTLALAQLWHVFNMTSSRSPLLRNEVTRNAYVWSAIAICIALLYVACHIELIAGVLRLVAPDGRLWAIVVSASLGSMLVGRLLVRGLASARRRMALSRTGPMDRA